MNRTAGDVLRLVLRTQPRSFGGGKGKTELARIMPVCRKNLLRNHFAPNCMVTAKADSAALRFAGGGSGCAAAITTKNSVGLCPNSLMGKNPHCRRGADVKCFRQT